jgi:hypothetical protein
LGLEDLDNKKEREEKEQFFHGKRKKRSGIEYRQHDSKKTAPDSESWSG